MLIGGFIRVHMSRVNSSDVAVLIRVHMDSYAYAEILCVDFTRRADALARAGFLRRRRSREFKGGGRTARPP